jgi:hypothetical protein
MINADWSPADIGGKRTEWNDAAAGPCEGWQFDRALADDEKRLIAAYLVRKHPSQAVAASPGWIGISGVKYWSERCQAKPWTPAQLGEGLKEWISADGASIPWVMRQRGATEEEVRLAELSLSDRRGVAALIDGHPYKVLPPNHPFKAPPDELAHLAPDHPWRKGTIQKPR